MAVHVRTVPLEVVVDEAELAASLGGSDVEATAVGDVGMSGCPLYRFSGSLVAVCTYLLYHYGVEGWEEAVAAVDSVVQPQT